MGDYERRGTRQTSVRRPSVSGLALINKGHERVKQYDRLQTKRLKNGTPRERSSAPPLRSRLTSRFFGPAHKRSAQRAISAGPGRAGVGRRRTRVAHRERLRVTHEYEHHPPVSGRTATRTTRRTDHRDRRVCGSDDTALPSRRGDPARRPATRDGSLRVSPLQERLADLGGAVGRMIWTEFFSLRESGLCVLLGQTRNEPFGIARLGTVRRFDNRGGEGGYHHHTTTVSCRNDKHVSARPTRDCHRDNSVVGGGARE